MGRRRPRASAPVTVLVVALSSTRTVPRASTALLPLIVAVGVFDTAANALIALAARSARSASWPCSAALYPIATILLARIDPARAARDRRAAGGLVALGGAALIAAG